MITLTSAPPHPLHKLRPAFDDIGEPFQLLAQLQPLNARRHGSQTGIAHLCALPVGDKTLRNAFGFPYPDEEVKQEKPFSSPKPYCITQSLAV
ncbi:MAG: hypothetical protein ACOZDD_16890 [Bacteroidota bacterium]